MAAVTGRFGFAISRFVTFCLRADLARCVTDSDRITAHTCTTSTIAVRAGAWDNIASLTEVGSHQILIFGLLFSGASFLPGRGCCGAVKEGAFRNIGLDTRELGRGVWGVVRARRRSYVGSGAHLGRTRDRHVGSVLRHGFIMQPAQKKRSV